MIGRLVWVSCDEPGCENEFQLAGRDSLLTRLRVRARENGWFVAGYGRPNSRDLCPEHSGLDFQPATP